MNTRILCAFALATCASAASANRVDLSMFETNGVDELSVDLWVDVIDAGSQVDMVFHNDSTDGAIANIYIESTAVSTLLLANGSIAGSTGTVDFDTSTSPATPPGSITNYGGSWGGNLFAVGAESPAPTNGINPGETLTISFDLLGSFGDVLAGLNNPDGGFRIAQHGISFGQNSVWTTTVPAPGAMAILAFGGVFAGRRRR
jgi:MYXO-CTERM domain-containing protein